MFVPVSVAAGTSHYLTPEQLDCIASYLIVARSLTLRFGGDNAFDGNWAYTGGVIFNEMGSSMSPPQDGGELTFENGRAHVGAEMKCL